tara:strand:+ start:132 stop:338 length:207 start_codon:yes stop_codon:yes gene_type:complete
MNVNDIPPLDIEHFRSLVHDADLNISEEELPKLLKAYEPLKRQLQALHELQLEETPSATRFFPKDVED